VRLAVVVLLLAGCDRLFGFEPVPATDARGAHIDATADGVSRDAPADVLALDAALPGAKLVQQNANQNNASGLSVTLAANPTIGNMLVVIGGATCGLTGVSGGGVATWQRAAYSGVSPTISVYYGVSDGSSASVHLAPQCTTLTWGLVTEWSGLATANTIDTKTESGAAAGAMGTGFINDAVNPTSAPDLLIFGVSCYGTIGPPAASWTQLQQVVASSTVTQRAWYEPVATAGQYVVDVGYTNDWDSALVAFRIGP
jgi:hypothetical protein